MSFHRRVDTKVSKQVKTNAAVQVPQAAKEKRFLTEVICALQDGVPGKTFVLASEVTGL